MTTNTSSVSDRVPTTSRQAWAATDGVVGNAHPTRIVIPGWLPRSIGAFLAGWLTLSGGLLYVRASLDATQPLGPGQLILAAVGLLIAAWFSRIALDTWPGAVVSLGLLLWGVALTRVGGSAAAIGLNWLLFLLEETWAWRRQLLYFRRSPIARTTPVQPASDDRIIQQFTRTLTPCGEEVIRGSVAVRIERGSRMGAGHIAFCPPFAERPRFDARFAQTQKATLKVTQLYAHGARIEVRLPQAAQADANLFVQFAARA